MAKPKAPILQPPTVTPSEVKLTWQETDPNAGFFEVFCDAMSIGLVSTTSDGCYAFHHKMKLEQYRVYHFYVQAFANDFTPSNPSRVQKAKALVASPTGGTRVNAAVLAQPVLAAGCVELAWAQTDSTCTTMQVLRGTTPNIANAQCIKILCYVQGTAQYNHTDCAVTHGTRYYYWIRSIGTDSSSADSSMKSILA